MSEDMALKACPFCGGKCDPEGWLGTMPDPHLIGGVGAERRGPECEDCGATAESVEAWNRRSLAEPKGVSDEMVEAALSAPVRHANGPTVSDFLWNAYPEAKRDIMRAALLAARNASQGDE